MGNNYVQLYLIISSMSTRHISKNNYNDYILTSLDNFHCQIKSSKQHFHFIMLNFMFTILVKSLRVINEASGHEDVWRPIGM
jgi:hypothetical protein